MNTYCKDNGHIFGKQPQCQTIASTGKLTIWCCNNCLTIKVLFENNVKINNEWTVVKSEHIVDDGTIERQRNIANE